MLVCERGRSIGHHKTWRREANTALNTRQIRQSNPLIGAVNTITVALEANDDAELRCLLCQLAPAPAPASSSHLDTLYLALLCCALSTF